MSYGWLSHRPDASGCIKGVEFDKAGTKTRAEEYGLVHNTVALTAYTTVLDAATGYVPHWHVLPYILAELGMRVETIDQDPRTMTMAGHAYVNRQIGNIASLPYPDHSFDVVTCISTLEHCPPEVREMFASEARRVLNPGGMAIITADNYPGISPSYLKGLFDDGFDTGTDRGDEEQRFPSGKRVAYLIARKR